MAKAARKTDAQVPRKRHIKEAPPPPKPQTSFTLELSAVLLLVFAVFLALAIFSELSQTRGSLEEHLEASRANIMGPLGAKVATKLLALLGACSTVIILWALLLARSVCIGWRPPAKNAVSAISVTIVSSCVLLCSAATIASVLVGFGGGGRVGTRLALLLIQYVNEAGALLIAGTTLVLALGVSTGVGALSLLKALRSLGALLLGLVVDALHLLRSSGSGMLSVLYRRRVERKEGPTQLEDTLDADLFTDEPVRKVRPKKAALPAPVPLVEDDDPALELLEDAPVRILRNGAAPETPDGKKKKKEKDSPKETAKESVALPAAPAREFELPSPEFLVRGESTPQSAPKDQELIQNSKRLEQTLQNFRIGGRVVEVHPGPVITLYQFEPAPGVKVQKIISLADDLALSLKVASVRVYAPVPGKGTVGIEVPNAHREIVRLRDLIETKPFHDPQFQIALALGKDTFGDPYIADLSKMPHLLIAGATGTGKSVCINSLLLSLLYRNTPDDLRLILIDPKMLELSVYEDIPHLKAPVVTLAKRARGVLWWAVEEMERRYAVMKDLGVRNLASYNAFVSSKKTVPPGKRTKTKVIELLEKDVVSTSSDLPALDRTLDESLPNGKSYPSQLEPLPRIVIVVDELADLMLTVGREIEELLTRLAQKARAAGIHLILATQRPSVNVITGLIKANFPSRISFKVASRIDARTVLDNSGAEKLLGQGDMLFLSPGAGRPKRLHSPFVSDKEVHDVVDFIRSQGRPDYDAQIESMIERLEQAESSGGTGEGGAPEEYDALYDQAVSYVTEKGMASTSMIQRIFRIGYNRAARILETMERDGVVGPADGAKPRQVLAPPHTGDF